MTPSLARILGERSRALPKPIRWFTVPQLFRYERQQKGRLREHFQWNVDIVGEGGVGADAEILAVALDALRSLGLGPEDIVARVSDRRLLSAVLRAAGVQEEDLLTAFEIVDKVEREEPSRSLDRLSSECGLSQEAAEALLELINNGDLDDIRTAHGSDEVVAEALADLDEHGDILRRLGFGEYLEVDLRIVRGLKRKRKKNDNLC